MSGQQAQDQAVLPTRIAFKLCMRGIRTRLGRSVVTLTGVALGIAFLMSVVSGFHIKEALKADAEQARDVARREAVLRANVGLLEAKILVVLAGNLKPADNDFIDRIQRDGATIQMHDANRVAAASRAQLAEWLEGIDAVLILGAHDGLLTEAQASVLVGHRIYAFEELPETLAGRLTSVGAEPRQLVVKLHEDEKREAAEKVAEARVRMYWIVVVSLLITVGGIANAMLMSVTERFREIATMKCLGALSAFVVKLFLIESSLMGLFGSLAGVLFGLLVPLLAYSYTYSFARVFSAVTFTVLLGYGLACLVAGMFLAVIAGIYPARVAAGMIPADALRSEV